VAAFRLNSAPGMSAISLEFRQFLPADPDLAMVPVVGSSDKRSADGSNAGEWLVNVADDVVVAMATLEVIDGLRKGRLSEQSLVWRIGMHAWTSIIDVPHLRLAAGSRTPPPTTARATQPPFVAQAEGRRRLNTLPLGFPAVRDAATVRQPVGFSPPSSQSSPESAALAGRDEPLAVYERPAASLTFSASGRADWQGELDSPRLTPVPSVTAPLTRQPTQSTMPNSLAPTTAETDTRDRARRLGTWDEFDELLASERRADQRSSRRTVLWAALGSASLAGIFALWVLRAPAPNQPAAASPQAAQASEAPALAATLEAIAAPSASAIESATAAPATRLAPKPLAPRLAKRAKPVASSASSSQAIARVQATAAAPDSAGTAPSVTVVPLAPLEPTPTTSPGPEATPAPVAPVAPDRP